MSKPIENMTTIVLAIKLTNYYHEMKKRGYDNKEINKTLSDVWSIVEKY